MVAILSGEGLVNGEFSIRNLDMLLLCILIIMMLFLLLHRHFISYYLVLSIIMRQ